MSDHRVVIIGAGFAGLWAAKRLAGSQADVSILDRDNYHTFLPLLYQVAAAEVEPEDIVYPVRSIFHKHPNVRFLMDEVIEVDLTDSSVKTTHHVFPYDTLILAGGSAANFFGIPGAAECAFQLKTLEQAIRLRNHILFRFERALCETDADRRRQMLTFAITGGGPTGVEFAGALAELIRGPLARDYYSLDFSQVQVLLIEAAESLLPSLPPELDRYAQKRLRRMGVEVLLQARVVQITPQTLHLSDGRVIPTETVVWTAGVRGGLTELTAGLPTTPNGRVKVTPTLQVEGYPQVYVAGDLAYVEDNGKPLPMVAPVAIQQGEWAASNILRQMAGQEPLPFCYRDPGTLATIGRNAAVAQLGRRTFTGFPAWLLWLSVHIMKLIGFRNRLQVLVDWAWDYLFYERAVRLIFPNPGNSSDADFRG